MLKTGDHRHVFVLGPIVIKVPRIALTKYFQDCGKSWAKRESLFAFLENILFDFWGAVLCARGGFMENLREATCFLRTRHRLLAPLYAPFIILNIYKRMGGVGEFAFKNGSDVCLSFIYEEGNPDIEGRKYAIGRPSHTFENPENFSHDNGDIFLLDYGEKGIERLLLTYGDELERVLRSKVRLKS